MINTTKPLQDNKLLLVSKLLCSISHLDDGECVVKIERIKFLHECIGEINQVLDKDKKINVNAKMDISLGGKIFERFHDSYKKIRDGALTCFTFDEAVDEARHLIGYVNLLLDFYAIKGDYHGKLLNSKVYTRTLGTKSNTLNLYTQIQDSET